MGNIFLLLFEYLVKPFIDFDFMLNALISLFYLSFSMVPIGSFLIIKRMSLLGDAMSHAILPGIAVAYIIFGLNFLFLSIGGFIAGILIVFITSIITRYSKLKDDASFTSLYLFCLALGVILIKKYGNNIELSHFLFGSILAIDKFSLSLILIISSFTIICFAIIYRALLLESIDPLFMKVMLGKGIIWQILFQMLVVINLVAGFQSLGTLMAVGLMMIPAIAAKLWTDRIFTSIIIGILIAIISGYIGLLLSFYLDGIPSGPAVIFICGICYFFSLLFGRKVT